MYVLLAILFAGTGFSLSRTLGHYHFPYVCSFAVFFLIWVFSFFGNWGKNKSVPPLLLKSILLFFILRLIDKPLLIEPSWPSGLTILRCFLFLSGLGVFLFLTKKFNLAGFYLAVIGLGIARFFVPIISPQPHIDVYVFVTQAIQSIGQGIPSYSQNFPDIYNGMYGYTPMNVYPPWILYFLFPFQKILGDYRYGLAFSDLGTVFFLSSLCSQMQLPKLKARLLLLLWLSFPVSLFVIERGWIDGILILFFIGFLRFYLSKQWLLSAVFLGLALASKQYSVFIALILLPVLLKNRQWRVGLLAGMILLLTFLPSLLQEPAALWRALVTLVLNQPIREDAFTLVALLKREWNFILPKTFLYSLYLGTIFLSLGLLLRRNLWSDLFSFLVLIYGVVFLFGPQAFCNYYSFLSFFMLCAITFESSKTPLWNEFSK